MSDPLRLGGIVLAGGRSSRMGTSKAELDWHGVPLVRHVAGRLGAACGPVVVVRAAGQRLPAAGAGVLVATDAAEGNGPLEAVAAGIRALEGRADAAFVVATDAPFLHPAFVNALGGRLGSARGVVPSAGGRLHPLTAVYRLDLLADITGLLAAGARRASLMAELPGVEVIDGAGLPHPESLVNLNTIDDYRAALLRGELPPDDDPA